MMVSGHSTRRWLFAAVAGASVAGCGDEKKSDDPGVGPLFPANYQSSYTEVRDCRQSADHGLMNVRILADAAALGPYQSRDEPFPEGAVVLKEQYEIGDTDCAGDVEVWTVMQKLAEGSSPSTLDWAWQSVDADRNLQNQDDPRCTACHEGCGVPPDGYAGTCAIP